MLKLFSRCNKRQICPTSPAAAAVVSNNTRDQWKGLLVESLSHRDKRRKVKTSFASNFCLVSEQTCSDGNCTLISVRLSSKSRLSSSVEHLIATWPNWWSCFQGNQQRWDAALVLHTLHLHEHVLKGMCSTAHVQVAPMSGSAEGPWSLCHPFLLIK